MEKEKNNISFVELYTKLYNENFQELENLRKKEKKRTIIGVIIFILIFLSLAIPGVGLIVIIGVVIYICKLISRGKSNNGINNIQELPLKKNSYIYTFKEKVMTPVIKYAMPDCEYFPYKGLHPHEYAYARWESHDLFDSEDMIITDIILDEKKDIKCKLIISEVHTQNEHTDDEGHTSYTTVFHGLAGHMDLPKDVGFELNVVKNKINLFGLNKNKIKMDMTEFEKMFDVETNDKIKAMQILTADVMADMINIVIKSEVKFEFKIKNSTMNIRFHTDGLFDPELFGKSMQFDAIKRYFDIAEMVEKVSTDIGNVILHTEL